MTEGVGGRVWENLRSGKDRNTRTRENRRKTRKGNEWNETLLCNHITHSFSRKAMPPTGSEGARPVHDTADGVRGCKARTRHRRRGLRVQGPHTTPPTGSEGARPAHDTGDRVRLCKARTQHRRRGLRVQGPYTTPPTGS